MKKKHVFRYETENIGVKGLALEDVSERYIDWLNDPIVCAYNSHGIFPSSRADVEDFIQSLRGDRTRLVWAVFHKEDNCHIGNISLQRIDFINRSAEIAFLFGESAYWGRGCAEESASLLMMHGFESLNLHRIYCATADENQPMQRLAEKLGMQREGQRREALFLNGHYIDALEYGILAHEFNR